MYSQALACSFIEDTFFSPRIVFLTERLLIVQAHKKTITALIDRYLSAYSAQNIEALLKLFYLEEPGFYFLGTGVDEKASTKKDLIKIFHSHFRQGKALAAKFDYACIQIDPPIAYIVGEFTFRIALKKQGELVMTPRFSAVLRQVGLSWLIQQLHCSMPWLEQPLNLAFPPS